ncbi:hypothetical protein GCM10022279_10070 [Comamonas faecalis]|uniref:Ubiquinone biosynthesis protein UbiJ n=2 Tax=Comamonas faecalis TaxID=1387849 RepID=A0ABP7QXB0_9BURK
MQSPFSFLDGLRERLPAPPQPPQWLVHEVQHRLVLFLNHVLMQESEAMARLARQSGRTAQVQWRGFHIGLQITPAGLLDLAPVGATPSLRVEVTEASALALASGVLRGDKPTVRIEGDVQLAGEINWVVEHVRWDVEDDLARLVGDAPAHTLARLAQGVAEALQRFAPAARQRPDGAPHRF